jgi:hypothetical protein
MMTAYGFQGVFLGTRVFPVKRIKRKLLEKYGDGGRALRSRQIKFYAAGVALSFSISLIAQSVPEHTKTYILVFPKVT